MSGKEKIEVMRRIIRDAFNSFNSLKFHFGVNVSRYERGVYSYLVGSQKFILPTTPSYESIKVSDKKRIDIYSFLNCVARETERDDSRCSTMVLL